MAKSNRDPFLIALLNSQGGATSLARKLELTPSAIMQWERVPRERCFEIEELTGIPREMLRPDIWHKKRKAAA